MSNYSWKVGKSGDWGTAFDWVGRVPNNAAAIVTIGKAGTYTVTIGLSESFSIEALTLSEAGATLAIAGTLVTSKGFNLAAGTINGTGRLIVTGGTIQAAAGAKLSVADLVLAGGPVTLASNMTDSGAFALKPGATLSGSGTLTLIGDGNSFAGTIAGSVVLTSSGVSSVANLTIGGTAAVTNNGVINVYGTVTIGDSATSTAKFINGAGGIVIIDNNSGIGGVAAGSQFANAGSVIKAGGAGTSAISASVTGKGRVLAATGTLLFDGANDVFAGDIAGAGMVAFGGGKQTLNMGATIEVATLTIAASDVLMIDTNIGYANHLTQAAGSTISVGNGDALTLTGTASFAGKVAGLGSLVLAGGSQTVITGAAFTIANLSMTSGDSLMIGVNTTVTGAFTLAVGATLNIARNITLTLAGGATLNGNLAGQGSIDVTGGVTTLTGTISLGSHQLTNQASGTIDFAGNANITAANNATFDNVGTLEKTAGMTSGGGNAHTGGKGGIAKFKVAIKNSGKLAVQVGDLDCAGSFNNMNTSAGIISIASGAELDFDQGGTSVAKAFTMVKGSYLTFNGGTFVLSSVPTAGAKRQTGIARTEISPDAVMFGGEVDVTAGTLELNNNDVVIGGVFSQTGGSTLDGTGTLIVEGGGMFTDVASTVAETGSGVTVLQSKTTVSCGGIDVDGGRLLENQGTLNWIAGTFNLGSGSQDNVMIQNDAGANFDIENDLGIAAGLGTTAFFNYGTVAQSVTTGTSNIGVAFTNSGTVSVGAGTLEFDGGFTDEGAISVSSGATLDFAGGATGSGTIAMASGGTLEIDGGQLALSGGSIGGSMVVNNTALTLNASAIGGDLTVFTSDLDVYPPIPSDLELGSGAVTVSGAFTQGVSIVDGTGTLTLAGGASFEGVDNYYPPLIAIQTGSGTTVLEGATAVVTGVALDGGRTLENQGTLTWTGGAIELGNNPAPNATSVGGGTVENDAGATFAIKCDGTVTNSLGTTAFDNGGTLTKSVTSGTTHIQPTFINSGAVSVKTGTLEFDGFLSNTNAAAGAISVSSGATLDLYGGASSALGTIAVSSGGTFGFDGGTFALGGGTFAGSVDVVGGTLSTAAGAIGGSVTVGGGTFDATAASTIGGFVTVSGGLFDATAVDAIDGAVTVDGGDLTLGASTITFGGDLTVFTSGLDAGPYVIVDDLELGSGAVTVSGAFTQGVSIVDGTGTLTLAGGASFEGVDNYYPPLIAIQTGSGTTVLEGATAVVTGVALDGGRTLENQGTLTWTGGAIELGNNPAPNATSVGGGTVENDAGATFAIKCDGTVTNSLGTTAFDNGGTLTKSVTSGTTHIQPTFINSGAVSVKTGTLEFDGFLSNTNAAAGAISVSSGATLDLYGGASSALGTIAVSSGGTFGFDGGTFALGGGTFAGSVDVVGGTLSTAAGAIGGSVTVGGGTFDATAASTIGGFVTVSGGLFDATAVDAIDGAVTVDGGDLTLGASTITFGGDLTVFTSGLDAGPYVIVDDLELGSGAVTVSGAFTQGVSIVDGTGTLTLAGGASFEGVDNYYPPLIAIQTGSGTTVLEGATAVVTGVALDGGRTLENQGTLTWTGGAIELGNNPAPTATSVGGGTIENDAGATFAIKCDGTVTNSSGTTAFDNGGTLTKSVTSGTTHIQPTFINSGAVSVKTGTLEFDGFLSNTNAAAGAISVSSGATLDLYGGASSALGTIAVSSGGTFGFDGGTFALGGGTFAGSVDVVGGTLSTAAGAIGGSVTVGGGTFDATAASTIGGFVTVSGGLFDATAVDAIDGAVTVDGGDLTLGASTITFGGDLTVFTSGLDAGPYVIVDDLELGSGAVTVSGAFTQGVSIVDGTGTLTLAGGASFEGVDNYYPPLIAIQTGSGTTVLEGATAVVTGVALDGGRTLENQGTLTWTGGAIELGNNPAPTATSVGGGTIENDAGATFAIKCDGTVTNSSGTTAFDNGGTLTKSVTSGTTHIQPTFINSGAVSVKTGTLEFDGFLSNTNAAAGAISVSSGATLDLYGGASSALGTIAVSSGGTFGFDGGTFALGGGTFAGSVDVVGGTLSTAAGAIGGSVTVGGGTFDATAASTIGGFVTVSGGLFDATAVDAIDGAVTVDGGDLTLGASTITFGGDLTVFTSGLDAGPYVIVDDLELGSGAVTVSGAFTQGVSIVDGTGTLTLAGGASFEGVDNYYPPLIAIQTGSGTTVLEGATAVVTGVALDGGRTLENQGTLTWTGGAIELGNNPAPTATSVGGGTIENDVGATFAIKCDGTVTNSSGTTAFDNGGTLTKSVTSGTTHIQPTFINSGAVSVKTGTLEFDGAVSGSGTMTTNGGALEFGATVATTQTIVFGANSGTLLLTDPSAFSAPISGFGTSDVIDLTSIAFSDSPTLSFVENANNKQGVLTITDGGSHTNLTLFGQYVAAGFGTTQDSGGGTSISYVPLPAPGIHLAASH